jgi:hypothetical protein
MNRELFNNLVELKRTNKNEYLRALAAYKDSDPEFYNEFIKAVRRGEDKLVIKKEKKTFELPDLSLILVFAVLVTFIIGIIVALFILT